ncbi:MAG TPA: glycosyltransferase family 2 protein [Bryobacteraceae bacterium]|nr:glycosyltransferase family 2 protein [Bryobacteraceae bacterium]
MILNRRGCIQLPGPRRLASFNTVLFEIIFWSVVFLAFYAYLGYPLVLLALRLVIRKDVRKKRITPFVSLLIPAYNEADVIERKIKNSLALDYPADRIEIVVASDGSSDETAAIAQARADGKRVRVLVFPQNRGKVATLNASVPELHGEVVVFSDAPAMLYPDSVRKLVENFADPEVGAVSGLYKVVKADQVNIGSSEDFYWKYETFLKVKESQLDSTLGGHGHLHAIRKALYPFPQPGTINDDYVIPVSVLAKGYRAVYEPSAIVYEEAHEMTGFGRRVRIMAGNIQQLREIRGLLQPLRPLALFFFLSHKLTRLLVPFAMLTALIANLFLLDSPLYLATLFGQLFFYLLAAAGSLLRLRPKVLMLPFYFCMINLATFFGFYHALSRRRSLAWK